MRGQQLRLTSEPMLGETLQTLDLFAQNRWTEQIVWAILITMTFRPATQCGYIYQCEYSLFHLLDRDKPTVQISIETIDDVVAQAANGSPAELLQLKNHRQTPGSASRHLTDRHEDLWKTLRVWATHILNGLDPSKTSFVLMTTSPTVQNTDSIVHSLAPKAADSKRDTSKAFDRFQKLATEISRDVNVSATGALKKGAEAFLTLQDKQRRYLVNNLTIIGSSPSITNLRSKIDQRLRASGCIEEAHPKLVEVIVGWWYSACIQHLADKGLNPITFDALERKIAETCQALNITRLPQYDVDDTLEDSQVSGLRTRAFVRQIVAVGHSIHGELINSAMLDYYKADVHRKRWIENFRVNLDELKLFESELKSNWSIHFGSAEVECDDCARSSEPERGYQKLGRKVLKDTLDTSPIDFKGFKASFLTRGTYHILASGDPPTIGWHPFWKARFRYKEPAA